MRNVGTAAIMASLAMTVVAVGCGSTPSGDEVVQVREAGAGGTDGGTADARSDVTPAATFSVGGTVNGLAVGDALVLQNDSGEQATVKANGPFSFSTRLTSGTRFDVTVKTQPSSPPQKCTVSGGTGTVVAGDVTSITVNCATSVYAIGGTITGLGGTVVLVNRGGDDLTVNSLGKFAFATTLASGAPYDVKVKEQPMIPSQTCAVTAGSGTVGTADVTTVGIACTTNRFTVGGSVTGLTGGTLVLHDNAGDDLAISADGPFTFGTAIASGATYAVTVTAPPGQACFVTNGTGTVGGAAVGNVVVACTPNLPNCSGLAQTCGAAGLGDCCASVVIPGGTFSRSYDGVTAGYTDPRFVATVSDFRLDTYEITVGRFRAFAAAYPASTPAAGAGKNPNDATDPGWDAAWNAARLPTTRAGLLASLKTCGAGTTWSDAPVGAFEESRAMNCVSWYEAFAFCIWDGARLPTEAEWNYAAAGGDEQRAYPWSTPASSKTIDATYATYNNAPAWDRVGSKPNGIGKWGHADLAGNVWEWTLDWARTPYATTPCNDCSSFVATNMHVVRGGGINNVGSALLASNRGVAPLAAGRAFDIGVRCARTP